MNNPDFCPHCGVSLDGGLIPEEINSAKEDYPYGKDAHWRREIGIEYPEKYDGVFEWKCPDCGGVWPSEVALLRREGTSP